MFFMPATSPPGMDKFVLEVISSSARVDFLAHGQPPPQVEQVCWLHGQFVALVGRVGGVGRVGRVGRVPGVWVVKGKNDSLPSKVWFPALATVPTLDKSLYSPPSFFVCCCWCCCVESFLSVIWFGLACINVSYSLLSPWWWCDLIERAIKMNSKPYRNVRDTWPLSVTLNGTKGKMYLLAGVLVKQSFLLLKKGKWTGKI